MKTTHRHFSWLAQAQEDYRWATDSLSAGHAPQTCFICQQVAEKALKALAFFRGASDVRGHSTLKIAKDLNFNGDIENAARILDRYYISARYPDAYPDGIPSEFITRDDAVQALSLAERILDRISNEINGIPGSTAP